MNIKGMFCLLLTVVLAASLSACGKGSQEHGNDTEETTGAVTEDKPYDYELGEYVKLGSYPDVQYSKTALNTLADNTVRDFCDRSAVEKEITDRPAKLGDIVVIDFVGTLDGVAFENGSGTDYSLALGSHSFIEGFEEGVVGHGIGEEFDLNLKFPDPYKNSPDKAGKDVVFTVKLKKITEKQIPELTDDIAAKFGFESKEALIEYATERALESVVWQSYVASAEVFKTPDREVEKIKNNVNEYYRNTAENANIDFETFVQYMGFADVDSYNTALESQVKAAVKEEMIIYQTERLYNVTYTDEEYAELGLEVAKSLGYKSLDEFKENASEIDIRREVVRKKIINILCENAVGKD